MHQKVLDEIVRDCVGYWEHDAPSRVIEQHSKELLAEAVHNLSLKVRILQRAAVDQLVENLQP